MNSLSIFLIAILLVGFTPNVNAQEKPKGSKTYYDNGTVKSVGVMKKGVENKSWYFYHENGNLSGKGNFDQGEKVGPWEYYRTDGGLSAITTYFKG